VPTPPPVRLTPFAIVRPAIAPTDRTTRDIALLLLDSPPVTDDKTSASPMGRERFTGNPFAELVLSETEVAQLHELSQAFIMEHVAKYEEVLFEDGGKVDERRWKFHSSKEDMRVYSERSQAEMDRMVRKTTVGSDSEMGQDDGKLRATELPVVISFGTIVGTLEDVMFGLVNPTLDVMRVKASYVDDIQGAAIMARLTEPSLEEPFNSLVIKWMELDVPLNSTNLVKNRDYVYMEATGFVRLSNGDRVGYHQLHSVEFPNAHALRNRIRGRFAVCGLFRQVGPNSVENMSMGTMEAGGDLPRFMQVPVAAKAFLSATKYSYCGHMKKLAWMLEKKQIERRAVGVKSTRHGKSEVACISCGKKPGLMGKSHCRLCYHHVCYSCKIVKKMSFIIPDGQLVRRRVPFCTVCINSAIRSSAVEAARDQIAGTTGTSASVVRTNSNSWSDTSSDRV
jgi:hypothetical protein